MSPSIFTIGHSNHPLDRFLALLARHEVEVLVDIRRFPGSRKHPHFNRDNLAVALQETGVEYRWLEALGGRRHKQRDESPKLGLDHVIQPPVFVSVSSPHFGHRFSPGFHSPVKLPRDWQEEQAIRPKSSDATEIPN